MRINGRMLYWITQRFPRSDKTDYRSDHSGYRINRTQLANDANYKEATNPAVSTYGAGSAALASRLTSLSNHKLAR